MKVNIYKLIFNKNKNFYFLSFATLICFLFSLLANVLWVRWLTQETFGNLKLILSLCGVASSLCFMGAAQASLMSAAQKFGGNFLNLTKKKVTANFAGSCFLILASGYYAWKESNNLSLALSLLICALFFPGFNLTDIWLSWYNGASEFLKLSYSKVLSAFLPILTVCTLILLNIKNLSFAVLIYVLLVFFFNIYILKKIKKQIKHFIKNNSIIQFGRKTNIPLLFGSLLGLDLVILNHSFSAKEVSIYAVALVLPESLKMAFSIFAQLFSPIINSIKNLDEFFKKLKAKLLLTIIGFILIGILGFFMLPYIYVTIFGQLFSDSGILAKWLWLVYALFGSTTYLGLALIAQQNLIVVYSAFAGYPLLQMGLFILFSRNGASGMILAKIIGIVSLSLFYVLAFLFYYNKSNKCFLTSFIKH